MNWLCRLWLKYFWKARPITFNIRLLVVADTHNRLYFLNPKLPSSDDYDLCVFLGDISQSDIRIILKSVPKEKIIGVLGNHDDIDNLSMFGITDLNAVTEPFVFNGASFAGLQGCIKYKENQPCYTAEESMRIADRILHRADIFVTHSTPYNFMENRGKIHSGNPAINHYLFKHRCPVNLCGHNHSFKQGKLINGSNILECYMFSIVSISEGSITIEHLQI